MQLRVLTLNIWGVRFIAKFIDQRLRALVEHLNDANNKYDIIGLQEVRGTGEDGRIECEPNVSSRFGARQTTFTYAIN